eukprot:4005805-Pleurochrysis_carterae.AAC.1
MRRKQAKGERRKVREGAGKDGKKGGEFKNNAFSAASLLAVPAQNTAAFCLALGLQAAGVILLILGSTCPGCVCARRPGQPSPRPRVRYDPRASAEWVLADTR